MNNSSIGTTTKNDGSYELLGLPLQTVELVFSSIGYITETTRLSLENRRDSIVVRLKSNSAVLPHFVVVASRGKVTNTNDWRKYGKMFSDALFSYSDFSKGCQILNPYALRFDYNVEEQELKAWADEPIRIKNKALGYEMLYWLAEFKMSNLAGKLLFRGTSSFKDLKGDSAMREEWEKNRNSAFKGSINHFIRTVYLGETSNEGFKVRQMLRIDGEQKSLFVPEDTLSFAYTDLGGMQSYIADLQKKNDSLYDVNFVNRIRGWIEDVNKVNDLAFNVKEKNGRFSRYFLAKDNESRRLTIARFSVDDSISLSQIQWMGVRSATVQVIDGRGETVDFSKNIKKGSLINVLYLTPIDPQKYVTRNFVETKLHFDDFWHITYEKEEKEKAYLKRQLFKKEVTGKQVSVLYLLSEKPLDILANGSFFEANNAMIEMYWGYERLDKLLPLDFVPDHTDFR